MSDANLLKAKVRDVKDLLFEGEVDRVSSFNEDGPFDIYPMHANFISIIQKGLTLYKDKQIVKDLKFDKAVLKVKQNTVKIFLGIETINLEENIKESLNTATPSLQPAK
jgi:F0F1-type ATP synthase epsilon subunit